MKRCVITLSVPSMRGIVLDETSFLFNVKCKKLDQVVEIGINDGTHGNKLNN